MSIENYKTINDFVIIKKDQFEKYKKAYDKNEQKKEYARNHMRAKYQEKKLNKIRESEELEEMFIEQDVLFQLQHVN
jgi:hypothetical protein